MATGRSLVLLKIMQAYTSKNALKTIVENFRKPRQLFMYHPIKFEINDTFPAIKTDLYSMKVNGTTYWFANMTNVYNIRDRQIFTHDGKYREQDFLKCLDEFNRHTKTLTSGHSFSTIAENCYTNALHKYLEKNKINTTLLKKRPAHFFAMNESQLFKYRYYEDVESLPAGYQIDKPNPVNDLPVIAEATSSYVQENSGKDVELVREKIKRFPSLCVRKDGQIAGFIASETNGSLAYLHVFNNHRGKNLGEKLEIGAAKIGIENGIRPCKFIDMSNQFYLDKARKSKLMDIVESHGTPIVFDQNDYQSSNHQRYVIQ